MRKHRTPESENPQSVIAKEIGNCEADDESAGVIPFSKIKKKMEQQSAALRWDDHWSVICVGCLYLFKTGHLCSTQYPPKAYTENCRAA